jgi:hypothetical protein
MQTVCTSKRIPHFNITKINWLMLFKEVIAVYREKHKKPQTAGLLIIKVVGTYFSH